MLAATAADGPRVVLLDDLHWSDEATLELIPELAGAIADLPLLVVGSYRSDGLPRDHLLRRVRHELRRAGRLDEIVLAPLDREGTAELVASVVGEEPDPELVATIHDRTQGLPFFVEELARALQVTGDAAPLPDTIRDAVMVSTSGLSAEAKAAADAAAVAGDRFPSRWSRRWAARTVSPSSSAAAWWSSATTAPAPSGTP